MLKDTLEELPPATVTEETVGMKGIRLANHVPGKPVALDFRPPEVCFHFVKAIDSYSTA